MKWWYYQFPLGSYFILICFIDDRELELNSFSEIRKVGMESDSLILTKLN
jgi:hypothetical protein